MLRRCYLGSMGFQILIWHGFVAPKLGFFFKEVKRAAIKRESKLDFCFFCVASYGGTPWGDREGHCWIFKNCLVLKVGRIFVDFRNYASKSSELPPASPEPPKICTPAFPSYSQSEVVYSVHIIISYNRSPRAQQKSLSLSKLLQCRSTWSL